MVVRLGSSIPMNHLFAILRYFHTIFKPICQSILSVCSYVVLYLRVNSVFLNADTPNTNKIDWNGLMVRKGRMKRTKQYLTVSVFRRYGNRTKLCLNEKGIFRSLVTFGFPHGGKSGISAASNNCDNWWLRWFAELLRTNGSAMSSD